MKSVILPLVFALTVPATPIQSFQPQVEFHFEMNPVSGSGTPADQVDLDADYSTELEVPLPKGLKSWRCIRHAEVGLGTNKLVSLVCQDGLGNSTGIIVRCDPTANHDEEYKDFMLGSRKGSDVKIIQFIGACKLDNGQSKP